MHLLVIEDNASDFALLKEFLDEAPNPPGISWVKDGSEALDYLCQNHPYMDSTLPDIILLDLGMPRIDGRELLEKIKSIPKLAAIPVIVLSTSRNPQDRDLSTRFGAAEFISKPHNLEEYEALVSKLLHMEFPRLAAHLAG